MKILIVRIGALGDVLHALPAVAALRAAHPDWQIDWVVDPRWQPLLVNSAGEGPVVNRVHLAETKLWSRAPLSRATLSSISALSRQLRHERYDLAIDMQGTLRSAIVTRLSGAPVRVGYGNPRESQATWFYTQKLTRHARHVVEQGYELLNGVVNAGTPDPPFQTLGAPGRDSRTGDDATTRIRFPHEGWADDWATTELRGQPVVLLAPGAGWGAKQWPAVNFAALARELRARGFDPLVNAASKDNPLANRVAAQSGGAARVVVCNVAGLLALARRVTLVVGGDSGPIHLAASLGIPLVALFGPTDPVRNGPWGAGPMRVLRDPASVTSYKHVAVEDPGLARISVEQVLEAALEVARPNAESSE